MPDTLKRLQAALAGRYRIDRELGRGGMATVFLAHDIQHDRPVALKVLLPELAAALGDERFEREIRLVARLQHPHILGVHDSGDADGLLWFSMPYVEGESLRDRLNRERQLSVDDAVRIVREAALALDYAHRHGVVHRDIKPENILLSDDQALVADFGIARALQGGESLTQTGLAVGTPAYMSPEQASGEKTLDGRTDVYSLGCVLYELLAGEPPFTGPNPQAVITRALTETPRSLSLIRASISSHLTSIVARAMARAPADRFATAAEFARALNLPSGQTPVTTQTAARPGASRVATWAVVLGLIVLAATAWLLRRPGGAHASDDGQKRIAVLPFENEGASEDDYFADGVADEVRTKLASVPKLQVIARSSSTQYRKSGKSAKEIGRELEVDYLLTGTVRWSRSNQAANRVRVNPELIDVSTSSTRWTEAFERDLSDVFAVQTDIASKVAQSLDIALGSTAQQRLAVRPTIDMAAWDAYLRGEQITQSMGVVDEKVLRQGLEHYGRAVELDSNFAEAWARLGLAHVELERSNATPEGTERARIAVERGFRLAPDRTETRLAMGRYLRIIKRDYQGAVDQFTEGLKADPNNAVLLTGAASAEQVLGRWDDAVAHLQLAAKLDPRSVLTARSLGYVLHDVRRYQEANAAADRALALSPANTAVIQQKSTNYLSMGWLDSARSVVRQALTHVDTTTILVRFSKFQEQMWVLDPSLWPLIVKLTPADFDGDRGHWGLKVGGTWALLGDSARARTYADSARIAFEKQLRGFPENAQLHELRGRALALGGHKREAIEEAERSLRMRETELDASTGPYVRFQVARILIQAGSHERALDLIEPLLTEMASDLTPAYLRLDPSFKPLYHNPRFQRLIGPAH
jgi:serine/threonine-protein kinase